MQGKWLISADYQARISSVVAARGIPTLDQQQAFRKEAAARRGGANSSPAGYRVEGKVAHITVAGLLTPEPDLWAEWFGLANTTYNEIADAVAKAESDPNVKEVHYHVSSGGGMVDGIDIAIYAIDSATKRTKVTSDYAASAGYWILTRAGVGGTITATGPMATFGSIGVAVDVYSSTAVKRIASTDAPNKRPDVNTEEGVAIVRAELDAIHEHFANDVADARGVSRDKVNREFGQGGMLMAAEAMAAGMIDDVVQRPASARKARTDFVLEDTKASPGDVENAAQDTDPPSESTRGNGDASPAARADDQINGPAAGGTETRPELAGPLSSGSNPITNDGKSVAQPTTENRGKSMDLATLQAQHPELYNKVLDLGVAKEQKRVKAHIKLSDGSGDVKLALKFISDGAPVDEEAMSEHFASARNGEKLKNRAADDGSIAPAADGGTRAAGTGGAQETDEERDARLAAVLDKCAAD